MEEDNKLFYFDSTPTRDVDGYIHVDPVTGESKAVSSELNLNGNRTVIGNNASTNLKEATVTGWNRTDRERLRRAFHMNLDDPETVRRIKTYHTNEDGSINWHSFNFNPWIADNFVSVTNPEGMARIRNAVKSGGDLAGYLGAAVLAAPAALEGLAVATPAVGRAATKGLDMMADPGTYLENLWTAKNALTPAAYSTLDGASTLGGAALNAEAWSGYAAEGVNNFVNNPNLTNGIFAGLGLVPIVGGTAKPIYNTAKQVLPSERQIWKYMERGGSRGTAQLINDLQTEKMQNYRLIYLEALRNLLAINADRTALEALILPNALYDPSFMNMYRTGQPYWTRFDPTSGKFRMDNLHDTPLFGNNLDMLVKRDLLYDLENSYAAEQSDIRNAARLADKTFSRLRSKNSRFKKNE